MLMANRVFSRIFVFSAFCCTLLLAPGAPMNNVVYDESASGKGEAMCCIQPDRAK
jgi:hypothetical protein